MVNRANYVTDAEWQRFLEFSENLETPNIVVNLLTIKRNFVKLQNSFPYADIFYAVKANPAPQVVSLLADLGSNFDIASRWELDSVMSLREERHLHHRGPAGAGVYRGSFAGGRLPSGPCHPRRSLCPPDR